MTARGRGGGPRGKGRIRGGERGSASVLAVGVIGATLVATGSWLGLCTVVAVHQRVSAAADAAALAAADAAAGFSDSEPCALAEAVAIAMSARIASCAVEGEESRVTVAADVAGTTLWVQSRAGPPPLTG